MLKRTLILTVLLSSLVTAPATAVQTDIRKPAAEMNATAEHAIKKLKAFERANVSLGEAISTVLGTKGGIIMSANFEIRAGKPVYEVQTYQDNSIWEGIVDAQTGNLMGRGKTTQKSQLDSRDKKIVAGLSRAYTSLAEGVVMAEDREPGKAIGARLDQEQGKMVIEVTVIKNAAVKTMAFDAQSGQVFS
jgi:uncharacterized membrane protein YkoI